MKDKALADRIRETYLDYSYLSYTRSFIFHLANKAFEKELEDKILFNYKLRYSIQKYNAILEKHEPINDLYTFLEATEGNEYIAHLMRIFDAKGRRNLKPEKIDIKGIYYAIYLDFFSMLSICFRDYVDNIDKQINGKKRLYWKNWDAMRKRWRLDLNFSANSDIPTSEYDSKYECIIQIRNNSVHSYRETIGIKLDQEHTAQLSIFFAKLAFTVYVEIMKEYGDIDIRATKKGEEDYWGTVWWRDLLEKIRVM